MERQRILPRVKVDDVELFYVDEGSGPPLVFLHGLGSSSEDWEFQRTHFKSRYRCLSFDLPGSGRSKAMPPFSLAMFAKVIAGALTQLNTGPVHLVGLSMGGMTSLQLALDFPHLVKTLTVVNASASVVPKTLKEKALFGFRGLVTTVAGPTGIAKLIAPKLFPKPEHVPLRAQFIARVSSNDPKAYLASSRAIFGWSVEERVHTLRCPVTFLCADQDYSPTSVKEVLAAKIQGAKVIVIPDSHHALPVECPEAFNQALEPLLAG
jgi:pimeloyl-ACP methyl ester carboxylesterase